MSRIIAAIVISLIAAFAVGAWLMGGKPKSVADLQTEIAADYSEAAMPAEDRLLHLEQVIAEEREARIILEDQLQSLIEEIARIDSAGLRANAEQQALAEERRERAQGERAANRDFSSMMRRFDDRRVAQMVEGGFSEDEARRLLKLESESQYKAMQAAYDAQRNGETLDPSSTANAPQSLLRAELGDSAYERYLEAQGQPAAIQVTQVLAGSPGSQVGLQPGDQILNYNGERVFNVNDLRELTMQGRAGEDVIIEIERDGVTMQLSVPRGPVGITGSGANIRSLNRWGGG